MIAIVDHAAGNLYSVKRAFEYLGAEAEITSDPAAIREADRIVIPGVGRAGTVMESLEKKGLVGVLRDCFQRGKTMLGICIGIQIAFERSEEDCACCLGLIPGDVRRFQVDETEGLKVPQMGWNEVRPVRPHPLFDGIEGPAYVYFVNSYYPVPASRDAVIGETEYGITFASAVAAKRLVATQFHLEKSGPVGLRMLRNFCDWGERPC